MVDTTTRTTVIIWEFVTSHLNNYYNNKFYNKYHIFQYYLVDDTLEVREVHTANDGRDPFPILICRQKVPKDRYKVESTFPSVVMELTAQEIQEYFTPKDFMIGHTVQLYNRQFFIYDCDNFTKAFYWKNFNVTDFTAVDVEQRMRDLRKMVSKLFLPNSKN